MDWVIRIFLVLAMDAVLFILLALIEEGVEKERETRGHVDLRLRVEDLLCSLLFVAILAHIIFMLVSFGMATSSFLQ